VRSLWQLCELLYTCYLLTYHHAHTFPFATSTHPTCAGKCKPAQLNPSMDPTHVHLCHPVSRHQWHQRDTVQSTRCRRLKALSLTAYSSAAPEHESATLKTQDRHMQDPVSVTAGKCGRGSYINLYHRRTGHFWRGLNRFCPKNVGQRPKNELQN